MENQGREIKKEGEVKTAEVRRKRQKNEDADRKKGAGPTENSEETTHPLFQQTTCGQHLCEI